MNIIVQTQSFSATTATLIIGRERFPCTLGRSGVAIGKNEGDGKTPIGTYPLRGILYRADRMEKPETDLPVEILSEDMGWCEDPAAADYNRLIRHPHPACTDRLWREDALYDIIVIVGYNDDPVIAGKGSAIFLHLARPAFTPTAGCVGLSLEHLKAVLKQCDSGSHITVLPPPG